MLSFSVLYPGDPNGVTDAAGSLLRATADGFLYRDGYKYVVQTPTGPIALAGACFGIYGKNLFARGKTDGLLWLSAPSGWAQVTDPTVLDPDFLLAMMSGGPNEPI